MSTTPAGITVVPAYRVVAHFVKRAQSIAQGKLLEATPARTPGLPFVLPRQSEAAPLHRRTPNDHALDSLERHLGDYVRHMLSGADSSYVELGVRWAVTQLGDPDLDALALALEQAEKAGAKGLVESALRQASAALPRPDLAAKVLLLPGDGQSRVLTKSMRGAMGISLGSQATLLLFWPSGDWRDSLAYAATHEYVHLVRNHLFPRSFVGGRAVFIKSGEPETMLDAMVAEGMADVFARSLLPDWKPAWLDGMDHAALAALLPRIARRITSSDPSETRRFVFGDGDRIPQWAGYQVGYLICKGYMERHKGARPAALVGMSAAAIYRGSGIVDSLASP
jgi:uncharacterized protein YjaZ